NLDPFLDDLFVRGIVLQAEGEHLQLRGAKGVLTPNTIARLKTHKGAILRKLTEPVARYPLSYGQEALWFTAQNAADSPLYNVSIALRIHAAVDLVALQRTFQAFVIRHPLLRTTFDGVNGKPEQVVQRFQELTVSQITAAGWDDATLDEQVLANHEQPFDLAHGPLLRVTLFTRSDTEHILLCTMHHIVTDGWSLWMLLDEFRQLYPLAQREPLTLATLATLPQPTRSYADYVAWQQGMVTGDGETLWRYWEQQLAGELPVLDLPTDRPRPRVQSYRGASHHFTLADVGSTTGGRNANRAETGALLSQQLRHLAQREGTTLYTLLLAAFQVLLHRYSSQEEILVGSPTAGRSRPEFAPIFGYFTSPVVLRGKLAGNPPFLDFLGQMRTTVLEALVHQDFPFGLLVERLQRGQDGKGRDSSRPPLYQATFALQKPQQTTHMLNSATAGEASRMEWGGLTVSPYELGQYQGRVDILLEMFEGPEEITATLRYSTDLFDAATIEQMARNFVTLLQGIVENPQRSIAQLPLLSTTEQQQLLNAGRGPVVTYPTQRCVHQLFADQAARTPDVDALVFLQNQATVVSRRHLTYRELNEQANRLAYYLQTCGMGHSSPTRGMGHTVDHETVVGICLDRSPEMVISILAVLKAGGAYVPLDPAYPPERMAFIMADAGLGWILTNDALAAGLPKSDAMVLRWEEVAADVAAQPTANPASQESTTAEQLAYVIYTSGSTGQPKGVMVTHRGIPNLAYAQMESFGVTAESRVLQFASFSFDASVSELFKTLLAGATLYLADRETLLPGPALIDLFKREAISMVTLPPSVLAALPVAELPALQSLIVAGETCSVELAQRWAPGRRFLNAYGPTEATVCATIAQLTPEEIAATARSLSIGQPIANVQVYILDPYQQPVPAGVPGELYIGGIGVARGYLNRPELTAEKFIANPFSTQAEAERLYRTGDRARYLPSAEPGRFQIEFLGRIDNQV
ncbi:MAG: amino acid adenylation domain-containing protein, partial [Caldilineaceae bacterium]|nr:amino acid adenylation domain-containing protein [Caldilineaceae bacterium]